MAATAVVLGMSSASATAPNPPPGPPGPPASLMQVAAGKVFDPSAIRPTTTETLFYPVAPCRIVDTRRGGGALVDSATDTFYVRGTASFAPQGGTGGGCGIPAGATAVTANVTAVGAAGAGYLSGFAAGTSEPATNFISYSRGQNITANPTLPLAAAQVPDLNIRNHGSPVQVLIDVTGYYVPQIQGLLIANGGVFDGTTRILSNTRVSSGVFRVTIDRDVTYCAPSATAYYGVGVYASATTFNGNVVMVYLWTLSADGTPLPFDTSYFYLSVIC